MEYTLSGSVRRIYSQLLVHEHNLRHELTAGALLGKHKAHVRCLNRETLSKHAELKNATMQTIIK